MAYYLRKSSSPLGSSPHSGGHMLILGYCVFTMVLGINALCGANVQYNESENTLTITCLCPAGFADLENIRVLQAVYVSRYLKTDVKKDKIATINLGDSNPTIEKNFQSLVQIVKQELYADGTKPVKFEIKLQSDATMAAYVYTCSFKGYNHQDMLQIFSFNTSFTHNNNLVTSSGIPLATGLRDNVSVFSESSHSYTTDPKTASSSIPVTSSSGITTTLSASYPATSDIDLERSGTNVILGVIIAITSIIFAIVICIVLIVCRRRRAVQGHEDSISPSFSDSNLPQHEENATGCLQNVCIHRIENGAHKCSQTTKQAFPSTIMQCFSDSRHSKARGRTDRSNSAPQNISATTNLLDRKHLSNPQFQEAGGETHSLVLTCPAHAQCRVCSGDLEEDGKESLSDSRHLTPDTWQVSSPARQGPSDTRQILTDTQLSSDTHVVYNKTYSNTCHGCSCTENFGQLSDITELSGSSRFQCESSGSNIHATSHPSDSSSECISHSHSDRATQYSITTTRQTSEDIIQDQMGTKPKLCCFHKMLPTQIESTCQRDLYLCQQACMKSDLSPCPQQKEQRTQHCALQHQVDHFKGCVGSHEVCAVHLPQHKLTGKYQDSTIMHSREITLKCSVQECDKYQGDQSCRDTNLSYCKNTPEVDDSNVNETDCEQLGKIKTNHSRKLKLQEKESRHVSSVKTSEHINVGFVRCRCLCHAGSHRMTQISTNGVLCSSDENFKSLPMESQYEYYACGVESGTTRNAEETYPKVGLQPASVHTRPIECYSDTGESVSLNIRLKGGSGYNQWAVSGQHGEREEFPDIASSEYIQPFNFGVPPLESDFTNSLLDTDGDGDCTANTTPKLVY